MPTTCELHRETTRTLPTEQVTTTPGRIHRSPTNPLWAAEFTLFLVRDAPTWGPQPWHGYSIAVWFSGGPWSKQTSFALLLRSCRNKKNIIHQSSSFRGCCGHQSYVYDLHPHGSPAPAWKRISGNIWTKKHWSDIGFPKWASAPMLVLITLGITGQLLSSLLTERHGKTVIKKQTKAFPSCRTLAIFIYLFKKYRLNAYSRPGTKCSECTFKGTDKSPLIWPSRCTVFYVGVHPTQHPAISTSGKTAMLAFSMYMVPSRLCSPWKPN